MESAGRRSPAPGIRSGWVLAGALAAASLALLATLDAAGRAARHPGDPLPLSRTKDIPVLVVRTNAQAVQAWAARGFRGATVLHAGRFLHFVPDEERPLVARVLTGPGRGRDLDAALLRSANASNHLWVAASTGIARRILYYPPPAALSARLVALAADARALPLAIPFETCPRTLLGALPSIDEPVLVEVHASWFDGGSGAGLLDAFRRSGLRTSLVVANLAEDAGDVSDGARAALRDFAASLSGSPEEAR